MDEQENASEAERQLEESADKHVHNRVYALIFRHLCRAEIHVDMDFYLGQKLLTSSRTVIRDLDPS